MSEHSDGTGSADSGYGYSSDTSGAMQPYSGQTTPADGGYSGYSGPSYAPDGTAAGAAGYPDPAGYQSPAGTYSDPNAAGYPNAGGYANPAGYPATPQPSPYPQAGYPVPASAAPGYPNQFAPYGYDPMTGLPYSDKSKVTAGILQLLLGGFGVGRFYLGQPGLAIAQIAVTWLTFGFGALWPFIDGIMMLTGQVKDSNGLPLRP